MAEIDPSRGKRWVIKIGSALLTGDGDGLHTEAIASWVKQIAQLHAAGKEVVIVSSGSVAEGMVRLGLGRRPAALFELQAVAAVGQMGIARVFKDCFDQYGIHTAQILLTHDDVGDRQRYLNARSTLRHLLELGVVPVVNENDTISTEAIMLGDNDTLAGLVCNLIEADFFVILTDQQGLYDADPRHHPEARLIESGQAGDPALEAVAGEGGELGRGGMRTKLKAAALAARSATPTAIVSGREPDVLAQLCTGMHLGTLLAPNTARLAARKQWLAGRLKVSGSLRLDLGAADVLRRSGRSLLAVGVREVTGAFSRGELVSCLDPQGAEIARGLVNYDSSETRLIMGCPSHEIAGLLGYVDEPELIHRDNLVMTAD